MLLSSLNVLLERRELHGLYIDAKLIVYLKLISNDFQKDV